MAFLPEYINYKDTGRFSSIVIDYTENAPELEPFISFRPNIDGLKEALRCRQFSNNTRQVLVNALTDQYKDIDISKLTASNIQLLANANTYTITTAHQPNIFTGHLYFIYKIAHVIRLAQDLNTAIPGKKFVPVFYMGSEDADLDELGSITIDGTIYKWDTDQKGAVGQMTVDDKFISLLAQIEGLLSIQPQGPELLQMISSAYTKGRTIEMATFHLVNELFGKYGLIVLLPGRTSLKALFADVVEKELRSQFSSKAVAQTISTFPEKYKVQAHGREINLFYLKDDLRERIEKKDDAFVVTNTDLSFSDQEILEELRQFPERFSPNVILRPVYQEMILPNIAFIGGGGELAYWLELKKVFEAAEVAFPVIVLRNSFLILTKKVLTDINKVGIKNTDLFLSEQEMIRKVLNDKSDAQLELTAQIERSRQLYAEVGKAASDIDPTLSKHIDALAHQAQNKLKGVEKKMVRAEKKKHEAEMRAIVRLRTALFPGNGLQERVDNFMPYFAFYGQSFIDNIIESSEGLNQRFTFLSEQ